MKKKSPLSPKYNAHAGDIVPDDDAYLMAEATVFNAILITENGKHLCYRENKYTQDNIDEYMPDAIVDEDKNDRSKGIVEINIQRGYYQDDIRPGDENGKLVKEIISRYDNMDVLVDQEVIDHTA